MNKVLVHSCCAPCSTYPFEKLLNEGFSVSGLFYNPNIYPFAEYKRRLDEYIGFMNKKKFDYFVENANFETWENLVSHLAAEREGGARCSLCFEIRLEKAVEYALKYNFNAFTTVLTVSPHKNSKVINEIGQKLSQKYNIKFIEDNFKKQDGFKKSLIISNEYNLYRQSYCGCKYSIR